MRFQSEDEPEVEVEGEPVANKVVTRRILRNETNAIYRKADALFSPFSCSGTSECCQLAVTKREPWLWPSEWLVLLELLRTENRAVPGARADGACRFLNCEGTRCTVYAARPLGCRTFFCHRIRGPEQQPTAALDALMQKLGAINCEHGAQSKPKPLSQWLSERPFELP